MTSDIINDILKKMQTYIHNIHFHIHYSYKSYLKVSNINKSSSNFKFHITVKKSFFDPS